MSGIKEIKIEFNDEDQILLIKIIKLQEPYLWYKNDVGKEFVVLDKRYERYYQAFVGNLSVGYIDKKCCEIVVAIQPRRVPDFPFSVKIIKNSWFPQCWYADKIGETFEVTNGASYGVWVTKLLNGNEGNIQKEDFVFIKS